MPKMFAGWEACYPKRLCCGWFPNCRNTPPLEAPCDEKVIGWAEALEWLPKAAKAFCSGGFAVLKVVMSTYPKIVGPLLAAEPKMVELPLSFKAVAP